MDPHPDTMIQMVDALEGECSICCKNSRCNRGVLPPGDSIITSGKGALRHPLWWGVVPVLVLSVLPW